jgi:hypothetical protein
MLEMHEIGYEWSLWLDSMTLLVQFQSVVETHCIKSPGSTPSFKRPTGLVPLEQGELPMLHRLSPPLRTNLVLIIHPGSVP